MHAFPPPPTPPHKKKNSRKFSEKNKEAEEVQRVWSEAQISLLSGETGPPGSFKLPDTALNFPKSSILKTQMLHASLFKFPFLLFLMR